jgi:hypothetical protein
MANGNPRPAFFLAVFAIVIGLVGLGLWRFGALPGTKGGKITKDEMATATEAPDTSGITTSRNINVPAAKLPPVQAFQLQATAGPHRSLAINAWAGWAPIILANNGFKAGKVEDPGGQDLKVD